MLKFSRLEPDDLFEIERQPSQEMLLGQRGEFSEQEAEVLAAQPNAWTAREDDEGGRIAACFGIAEPFPGVQGLAWSLLSTGIGSSHLQLTRFCRNMVEGSGLGRVEVLAKAADPGPVPFRKSGFEVTLAMHPTRATPECRWAVLCGFRPAHFLYRYGALSEPYMLFEWFPEYAAAAALERRAA